ncbi:MAG: hypothetical protein Q9165_005714 [Trypethelium subeluteriae]
MVKRGSKGNRCANQIEQNIETAKHPVFHRIRRQGYFGNIHFANEHETQVTQVEWSFVLKRDVANNGVARSPSTSPPPEPPLQEFMRDGSMADDAWIMVEDEFLQTAKLYTQHLHHAEYQRLKSQAKAQKASAIQSLIRPVTNPEQMSTPNRKGLDTTALSQKQDGVLGAMHPGDRSRTIGIDPSDDEELILSHPHLAGLMTRPARTAQKLSGLTATYSNTRAAAGFTRPTAPSPQRNEEFLQHPGISYDAVAADSLVFRIAAIDDDSENLENPVRPAFSTSNGAQNITEGLARNSPNSMQDPFDHSDDLFPSEPCNSRKNMKQEGSSRKALKSTGDSSSSLKRRSRTSSPPTATSDLSADGTERQSNSLSAVSARIKERRKARKYRLEGQAKSQSANFEEVPTFLV